MYKPDFFIISSPRSGSTLFRLMLTAHPDILVPQECAYILKVISKDKWSGTKRDVLEEITGIDKFENLNITPSDFKSELDLVGNSKHEILHAIFTSIIKSRGQDKQVIGDKNNFYLNYIPELNNCFPEAKFIHLVRDGRDVITSYRRLQKIGGKYAPNLPDSLVASSKRWQSDIQKIDKYFAYLPRERKLTIRYEDLVTNPVQILKKVAFFLNVNFDEKMLAYHKNTQEYESGMDGWKKMNKLGIQTSRVDLFKSSFFKEELFVIQRIMRKELENHGYTLVPTQINFLEKAKLIKEWISWII